MKGEKLLLRFNSWHPRAEVEQVMQNQHAIGYIGMGYITEEVKGLTVEGVGTHCSKRECRIVPDIETIVHVRRCN